MKRWMFATLFALGLAGTASADNTGRAVIRAGDTEPVAASAPAGPVSATGTCSNCGGAITSGHSGALSSVFHKLFWWKKSTCSKCGPRVGPFYGCGGILGRNNGTLYAPEYKAFNPYPNGVPGTLVFPQHPFVRSPRDYFMWEAK